MRRTICLFLFTGLAACQSPESSDNSLLDILSSTEGLQGKKDYLNSPYVTAGDRLYVVGHQNGTFPDHGWHVAGEMGGVWDHPIKLLDGFEIAIETGGQVWNLDNASKFTNYPTGNVLSFNNELLGLEVERLQFVPDQTEGVIIELMIRNKGASAASMGLSFKPIVDLSPVWITERLGIEDGEDQLVWDQNGYFIANDQDNPWYAVMGSGIIAEHTANTIEHSLTINPGQSKTVQFFIAGSYESKEKAVASYQKLKTNPSKSLQDKIDRYESLDKSAQINIPSEELQKMYEWTKYNTDWLIRDVDTIGRGLSAGMADYPWWFGADNCYSMQGLLATGQHEEVYATIDLIAKLSLQENGNSGQIIHEASTNGVVFNPGNLNETPHFVFLLWEVYQWTGNKSFLEKHYALAKNGMNWILEQDHDGNMYADGPGMMEIPGLHTEMVDVAVYTQQGAAALAKMASVIGDSATYDKYARISSNLKDKINSEWWSEEANSFADFRANKKKTLELIDAAIIRSDTIDKPWAVEELRNTRKSVSKQDGTVQSQVVYHNWVVNTPMEMGLADPDKAQRALIEGRKYRSKYGAYVTGLDRDESKGASTKWEVFSYVGAVMTLPTGVQAISENNYGNPDEALTYLEQLTNSFSYALPGSTYEVSPDYGMMAQAWNIYALAYPIVRQFFGIQPDAPNQTIRLVPQLPSSWGEASISKVKVGDNLISMSITKANGEVNYKIDQTEAWTIELEAPEGSEVIVLKELNNVVTLN